MNKTFHNRTKNVNEVIKLIKQSSYPNLESSLTLKSSKGVPYLLHIQDTFYDSRPLFLQQNFLKEHLQNCNAQNRRYFFLLITEIKSVRNQMGTCHQKTFTFSHEGQQIVKKFFTLSKLIQFQFMFVKLVVGLYLRAGTGSVVFKCFAIKGYVPHQK